MFELLNSELEKFSRETLSRHLAFDRGEWSASSLALHQLTELRNTLAHVVSGSTFYKDHLAASLDQNPIGEITTESFASLPFTTKDHLRERGFDMLSKPVNEAWVFYETTGTTGKATPCPRDNIDSTVSNTALTVNYASVLRKHPRKHVIGVMGPTELHSTGDAFGEVFRNLGQCVVKMWPHSPVVGYRRALEVMAEIGVTALVCTPGMAMALAREAVQAGWVVADFGLDFIQVVGELATPALLENISAIWSTTVYNCMYASQEASIMAAVRDDGQLRTVPLNNFYEVIDPSSGQRVEPDEAGEREGELVITHLFQGCKPLVRYRTGDLVRLRPSGSNDAYPSDVITPLGRVRDVTHISGAPFTAYALEQAVLDGVTGCYGYQITIDETDGIDAVHVIFEFMDGQAPPHFDASSCSARIGKIFGTDTTVRAGAIGSIATTGAMVSWKASRVHDRRQPDDTERSAALAIAAQRDSGRP